MELSDGRNRLKRQIAARGQHEGNNPGYSIQQDLLDYELHSESSGNDKERKQVKEHGVVVDEDTVAK